MALNVGSLAAASGSPSTCEVLSAVTWAATEAPQFAIMAGPTARTGGEVMIPWAEMRGARKRVRVRMWAIMDGILILVSVKLRGRD